MAFGKPPLERAITELPLTVVSNLFGLSASMTFQWAKFAHRTGPITSRSRSSASDSAPSPVKRVGRTGPAGG